MQRFGKNSMDLGKWFLWIGCFFIFVGGLIWLFGKVGIPFGQLPGDMNVSRGNFTFNFPIVTSIVLSIILTIILNIILALFKK
jgi:hypothetical protein